MPESHLKRKKRNMKRFLDEKHDSVDWQFLNLIFSSTVCVYVSVLVFCLSFVLLPLLFLFTMTSSVLKGAFGVTSLLSTNIIMNMFILLIDIITDNIDNNRNLWIGFNEFFFLCHTFFIWLENRFTQNFFLKCLCSPLRKVAAWKGGGLISV